MEVSNGQIVMMKITLSLCNLKTIQSIGWIGLWLNNLTLIVLGMDYSPALRL